MAYGKVKLVCKKCGHDYEMRLKFSRRRDADKWEESMQDYEGLCYDCIREERQEEYRKKMKGYGFRYTIIPPDTYWWESGKFYSQPIRIAALGDTYDHREQLKELGFSWWYFSWDFHGQSVSKAWQIEVPYRDVQKTIDSLKSIGASFDMCSFNGFYATLNMASFRLYKNACPYPAPKSPGFPAFAKGHRWNKKIYKNTVYLDGDAYVLSKEDREDYNRYIKELQVFDEQANVCASYYQNFKPIVSSYDDKVAKTLKYIATMIDLYGQDAVHDEILLFATLFFWGGSEANQDLIVSVDKLLEAAKDIEQE